MFKKLKKFKIVLLEDSDFYNKIMSQQIKTFTEQLGFSLGCRFEVHTFMHPEDLVNNLESETDIAVLDYYLGDGRNSLNIVRRIRNKCGKCKVAIISRSREALQKAKKKAVKIDEYIFKDMYALPRACFFIEDIASERLEKLNKQ